MDFRICASAQRVLKLPVSNQRRNGRLGALQSSVGGRDCAYTDKLSGSATLSGMFLYKNVQVICKIHLCSTEGNGICAADQQISGPVHAGSRVG